MRVIFTSGAQYRLLVRSCRGARLPLSRYRPENRTVRSLVRKGLWVPIDGVWKPTALGQRVRAARNGFLKLEAA